MALLAKPLRRLSKRNGLGFRQLNVQFGITPLPIIWVPPEFLHLLEPNRVACGGVGRHASELARSDFFKRRAEVAVQV